MWTCVCATHEHSCFCDVTLCQQHVQASTAARSDLHPITDRLFIHFPTMEDRGGATCQEFSRGAETVSTDGMFKQPRLLMECSGQNGTARRLIIEFPIDGTVSGSSSMTLRSQHHSALIHCIQREGGISYDINGYSHTCCSSMTTRTGTWQAFIIHLHFLR